MRKVIGDDSGGYPGFAEGEELAQLPVKKMI